MVSKIKVDEIESSQSGGAIAYNSSMKLKQLTTSQINALTGMGVGEMVYDTDLDYIKVYNGDTWGEINVASVWAATGGDTVETVGAYKYHYFHTSSNFVVTGAGSKNCDVYVIGGGGAAGTDGGSNATKGGGGGGMAFKTLALSAGSHTVTVGSGGDQVVASNTGGSGGTSGFSTLSATGGAGSSGLSSGGTGGTGSGGTTNGTGGNGCLLYTSPSPRDATLSRMPSSA